MRRDNRQWQRPEPPRAARQALLSTGAQRDHDPPESVITIGWIG